MNKFKAFLLFLIMTLAIFSFIIPQVKADTYGQITIVPVKYGPLGIRRIEIRNGVSLWAIEKVENGPDIRIDGCKFNGVYNIPVGIKEQSRVFTVYVEYNGYQETIEDVRISLECLRPDAIVVQLDGPDPIIPISKLPRYAGFNLFGIFEFLFQGILSK